MADSLSMALTELLRKAEAEPDLDTLREGVWELVGCCRVGAHAALPRVPAARLQTQRS